MSRGERLVRAVWRGATPAARFSRSLLTPLSLAYGAVIARRNARYDRGTGVEVPVLPALSVGNLTVGGTGKTPMAAWLVQALRARGARPAIVLRGYGDDETRVHALLSPGVAVVADADRVRGIAAAAARGADCVVLDDAFQHRRVGRVADLVLLAADDWRGTERLLPAGPWREPLGALARADVAVVTAKAVDDTAVEAVVRAVTARVPVLPIVVAGFGLARIHPLHAVAGTGGDAATDGAAVAHDAAAWLTERRVLAVSAIGDPDAFEAQLRAAGADVRSMRFRDHHAYDARDVAAIVAAAGDRDVVCTLKDAVKLAAWWPRGAPAAWYVSQALTMRRGGEALATVLDRLLAARLAAPFARSMSG